MDLRMARAEQFRPKNRVQTRTWAEWWEGDKNLVTAWSIIALNLAVR